MFEVQGKIEAIFDTQQVTDRFRKREFVIEIQSGMYPEYIKMQLTQDRCSLVDTFKVGDIVKVSFNLRGRPYDKGGERIYFTNIDAWRVDAVQVAGAATPPPAQQQPQQSGNATPPSTSTNTGGNDGTGMSFSEADEDDLPF